MGNGFVSGAECFKLVDSLHKALEILGGIQQSHDRKEVEEGQEEVNKIAKNIYEKLTGETNRETFKERDMNKATLSPEGSLGHDDLSARDGHYFEARNKPLREIIIDEHQVMGIWSHPISGYWYGYRSTKGVYQIRSAIQLPRQLWEFIVENEIDNKFIPKPQKPREPAFDIENLKVALNNITIMYGPPDATIRQAERAMMAYLSELCNEEGH